MTHVVIANGPPFTGKDYLVTNLMNQYKGKKVIWSRFKDVLYRETYKRLCNTRNLKITLNQWIAICNDVTLKDHRLPHDLSNIELWIASVLVYKELVDGELCISPRDELIYESEEVIKVKHGEGGVAILTVEEIKKNPDWRDYVYFFSDGGFNVEINVLREMMELQYNDMTIIRLDANGCNYDNDSREYIENPNFYLWNNKGEHFVESIKNLYPYFDNIIN